MSELDWLREDRDAWRVAAKEQRDEVERLRAALKAKVEATPLTETTTRMLEAEARVAELEKVLDALHEGTTKGGSCSPSEDA